MVVNDLICSRDFKEAEKKKSHHVVRVLAVFRLAHSWALAEEKTWCR